MSYDYTELQSGDDEQRAKELSLRHTRPPTHVPGYELTRFLGSGAYGEVWIGLDKNTGRRVAVKFYQNRGGVDWSSLSREVEKLVLLSTDRYIVQLLDVGWQADPPYYVMEYIENGSLEDSIRREEQRSIEQIVELFREITIGLNHAHSRAILHCDLKPANVLLDQESRPRLADFGQSRLTGDQTPSLGTLFYMAPEQADLNAVPDAGWDVYALGAILYCMLAGRPPHYHDELVRRIEKAEDLPTRLSCYRQWITTHKLPDEHRKAAGVDRALSTIVDRCLAPRPSKRFANVQSVLDALRARESAKARRPLLLLGVLGPILLLAVMIYGGKKIYDESLQASQAAVTEKVLQSNAFAAKFVATSVATEIKRHFRAVERAAEDPQLRQLVLATVDQLDSQLSELADPNLSPTAIGELRKTFAGEAVRLQLQKKISSLMKDPSFPSVASWFVCGPRGTHLAGEFNDAKASTIGANFAYRTYCHGGLLDLEDRKARPMPGQHVRETFLSAPLFSTTTKRWKIAFSTPLYRQDDPSALLGVLALTADVGDFMDFPASTSQFAVLVDGRRNGYRGMILEHPLIAQLYEQADRQEESNAHQEPWAKRLSEYRVRLDAEAVEQHTYQDPLVDLPGGDYYRRSWMSASERVRIRKREGSGDARLIDSGLIVFVQEDEEAARNPVTELANRLYATGKQSLLGYLLVVGVLWCFVFRFGRGRRWWKYSPFSSGSSLATPTPNASKSTALEPTARANKSP